MLRRSILKHISTKFHYSMIIFWTTFSFETSNSGEFIVGPERKCPSKIEPPSDINN